VGSVIRPFQVGKINVLTWYVLDGRIRRFTERQGVAGTLPFGDDTGVEGFRSTLRRYRG